MSAAVVSYDEMLAIDGAPKDGAYTSCEEPRLPGPRTIFTAFGEPTAQPSRLTLPRAHCSLHCPLCPLCLSFTLCSVGRGKAEDSVGGARIGGQGGQGGQGGSGAALAQPKVPLPGACLAVLSYLMLSHGARLGCLGPPGFLRCSAAQCFTHCATPNRPQAILRGALRTTAPSSTIRCYYYSGRMCAVPRFPPH